MRPHLKLYVLAILPILILAGCGKNESPSETKTETPQPKRWLFNISENRLRGYIDSTGKIVAAPQWDMSEPFLEEGVACVKKGDSWAIINLDLDTLFSDTGVKKSIGFFDNVALFEYDPKVRGYAARVVDAKGKVILTIQDEKDVPARFVDGWGRIHRKKGSGSNIEYTGTAFMNLRGEILELPDYPGTGEFSDGFAYVYQNNKYGYIDTTGKLVIPFEFDFGYNFYKGHAIVEKNNLYGIIDKTGNFVIEPELTDLGISKEKFIVAKSINSPWAIRDMKGKILKMLPNVEGIRYGGLNNGMILTTNEKRLCGFIDEDGNELLAPGYYNLKHFEHGLADGVDTSGHRVYLNRKFKVVWRQQVKDY